MQNLLPLSLVPHSSYPLSHFFLPSLLLFLSEHFLLRKIYLQIHWKLFPPLRGFTEN